ncbi:SRPBCC domain-containing protein [Streptomyces sp. NPDC005776]|uniref:SRPBCC domain-containing protein n=1 Tax=Streptomyces sp. NPDC005776 TaxID=3154676 RepID=UPI0033EC9430
MEHEVFVPVPVPALRRTLGDPARVARCVPGLQQDADTSAGPLSGRLKVRAGGHTITYRGALRLTPLAGGEASYGVSVAGEGTEARGSGAAKLALTVRLAARDGGTAIAFEGTVTGDGRLLDLDPAAASSAAHRLLDRFAQQLVTETLAEHGGADGAAEHAEPGESDSAPGGAVADDAGESGAAAAEEQAVGEAVEQAIEEAAEEADTSRADQAVPPHDGRGADDAHGADEAPAGEQPPDQASVFDTPVPPSALDPVAGIEFTVPDGPPAEAAHARRTMIGRSAEEVDHAPPRGRYAPVPSPDANGAGATLRWVAPAAALALASAVVVGRALRRRR